MKNMKCTADKMILQAMEAEDRGMKRLAKNTKEAVQDMPKDLELYSFAELKEDIKKDLWKSAVKVMLYHDIDSVNILQLDENISVIAEKYVVEIEKALDKNPRDVGALEPNVPGQR